MRFEIIREVEGFSKLEESWDKLWDELGSSVTPFCSYAWYAIWWKHYSAGGGLHLMTMWDDGLLVGVAPFMLRRATLHGLPVKIICFMENNQSFLSDFIVLPEYREKFLRGVFQRLFERRAQREWDAVVLNKMSTSTGNYRELLRILEDTGKQWCQNQVIDGRYLVPEGTWENFFSSRSTRTRKTLRNIQNSIRKAGSVSVRNIHSFEDYQCVSEEFFTVARGSWTEDLGDSIASPANRPFFEDLIRVAAAKGWLSLWALNLNGKMIAIEFHLRAAQREYAMRGHYLPEFRRLSPGTFLELQILQNLFEEPERVKKYDLGNYYNYKQKWTDASESFMSVILFNDSMYSRLVAFHEMEAVPRLRSFFPTSFWESKVFQACGINTKPIDMKQH